MLSYTCTLSLCRWCCCVLYLVALFVISLRCQAASSSVHTSSVATIPQSTTSSHSAANISVCSVFLCMLHLLLQILTCLLGVADIPGCTAVNHTLCELMDEVLGKGCVRIRARLLMETISNVYSALTSLKFVTSPSRRSTSAPRSTTMYDHIDPTDHSVI